MPSNKILLRLFPVAGIPKSKNLAHTEADDKQTNTHSLGGHHSSVDPSVPTNLRPGFESQAQHLHFFQFIIELWYEVDENINKNRQELPNFY